MRRAHGGAPREAHGAVYTHAGPEIGVASTKAFTAQLTALFLLALKLGQIRGRIDAARSIALMEELSRVPGKIEEVLRTRAAQCEQLAAVHGNRFAPPSLLQDMAAQGQSFY